MAGATDFALNVDAVLYYLNCKFCPNGEGLAEMMRQTYTKEFIFWCFVAVVMMVVGAVIDHKWRDKDYRIVGILMILMSLVVLLVSGLYLVPWILNADAALAQEVINMLN